MVGPTSTANMLFTLHILIEKLIVHGDIVKCFNCMYIKNLLISKINLRNLLIFIWYYCYSVHYFILNNIIIQLC